MKTLALLLAAFLGMTAIAPAASVQTLVGTGQPGYSDTQINNPYGMVIGPDGAMYFCDLGNQVIRRLDLKTKKLTLVAGTPGKRGYTGDGGKATEATLAAPHELLFDKKGDLYIAERDNNVVRKVDMKTGIISTVAGTGKPGFSGDGGPGNQAMLNQPHSIFLDRDGTLLICDILNHRIRRLNLSSGKIESWAGTGETKPTPDGASVVGTPVTGPRTFIVSPKGDLYLSLREGNQILRIDAKTKTYQRIAGTGELGFTGDNGPALKATFGGAAKGNAAKLAGPKGLAYGPKDTLYIADTDSHAIRKVDLKNGVITTVLGTGEIGDGPETDPLKCKLNRPHGVLFANGVLYVSDSEAHRIRILKP